MRKFQAHQLVLMIGILLLFAAVSIAPTAGLKAVYSSVSAENEQYSIFIPIASNIPALTNCRYGVNNRPGLPGNQWMTMVGAGHYINFRTDPVGRPVLETVEHLHQIRLQQDRKNGQYLPTYTIYPPLTMAEDGLGPIIQANLGHLWIAGNEPDVANIVQDNIYPDMYARAYHEIYYFIKNIDPTAQVAIGGLSMMTPGRLQYLDIMWDTYVKLYKEPMPVDVWNMHLYILPEIRPSDGGPSDGKIALGTDPALARRAPDGPPEIECPKDEVHCRAEHDSIEIFKEQIIALRSWMKNHGHQDRPLLLSEFSLLYPFVDYDDPINPTTCFLMDELGQCFTEKRVSTYMQRALNFLETASDPNLGYPGDDYRLVQQWAWYSMITGVEMTGGSSNLLVQNYLEYSPDAPNALTLAGRTYRERSFRNKMTVNLVAGEALDVEAQASQPGGTADVRLELGFYNNGNTPVLYPFVVVFYEDEALTKVIGGVQVSPGIDGLIHGCSWGRLTDWTSMVWKDVPVGVHPYWVKVDNRNDIRGEVSEMDNVATGIVTVKP